MPIYDFYYYFNIDFESFDSVHIVNNHSDVAKERQ